MSDSMNDAASRHEMLMELTAEVVAAYVSNNSVPAGELPSLISEVHAALGRMDVPAALGMARPTRGALLRSMFTAM